MVVDAADGARHRGPVHVHVENREEDRDLDLTRTGVVALGRGLDQHHLAVGRRHDETLALGHLPVGVSEEGADQAGHDEQDGEGDPGEEGADDRQAHAKSDEGKAFGGEGDEATPGSALISCGHGATHGWDGVLERTPGALGALVEILGRGTIAALRVRDATLTLRPRVTDP